MATAKLRKCVKFELLDMGRGIAVFFGVVLIVYAVNLILSAGFFGGEPGDSFFSGIEMCAVIFLFVSGIVMFGQYFRMFLQCGMGRGLLSGSLMLSVPVMALIVTVLNVAAGRVMDVLFRLLADSAYYSLWDMLFPEAGAVSLLAVQWSFLLAVTMFGLLISAVFQLVPAKARFAYCAAVPVCLVILLFKGVDGAETDGWPAQLVTWAIADALHGAVLFLGASVVLGALVCGVSRKIWLR